MQKVIPMRPHRISFLIAIALALSTIPDARGQDRTFVRIETNYPDAVVYADSVRLGRIYGETVSVPSSVRTFRLLPPEVDTWSIAPVTRTVEAAPGDTVVLRIDFPYHYRVESIPFGAAVHIESREGDLRRIGTTPALYSAETPIQGSLVIERPGFVIERLEPGEEIWNRHVVELSPSDNVDLAAVEVNWKPPSRHRAWIDYVALGGAVAAGAVAIHYKFKADDLYARYEDTGDPALRDDIKGYDLRSGIALGAMQVGIGIFAVRLALR